MGITQPVSKPISIFSIPYYTTFSILLQYLEIISYIIKIAGTFRWPRYPD